MAKLLHEYQAKPSELNEYHNTEDGGAYAVAYLKRKRHRSDNA